MIALKKLLTRSVVTTLASTATTTALTAWLGKKETGSAAAPFNATSHIVHGEEAVRHNEVSAKYTLTGVILNAAAMLAWSGVQEFAFGRWARKGTVERAVVSGAATSALAYVTDYHVVPKRLTPGFEKRLSNKALFVTYVGLALALAAGTRAKK
ncbi:MAG: hypothetical protein ACO1SV_08905 [Fimbriimonas sp.]